MDLKLDGKLALVTGSTAGIGYAIAAGLAREGARVIVTGRTQKGVDEAVAQMQTETRGQVIGVAGDRIRIDGGQVYVNGEALDEDYVPPAYDDARSFPETVVPPHTYFVLGDHRSMSSDSREFGPVNQTSIYGKAVFGYWPMDKLGRVR